MVAAIYVSDIDECVNVTCEHGGSCADGVNLYNCTCETGFIGEHCETSMFRSSTKMAKGILLISKMVSVFKSDIFILIQT